MSEFLRELNLNGLSDFSTSDNVGFMEMLTYLNEGRNERFNELDFED